MSATGVRTDDEESGAADRFARIVDRPERESPDTLDTSAWNEPKWWQQIRVTPTGAAGGGLIAVILVIAAVILVRLDSGIDDSLGEAPDLPLAAVDSGEPGSGETAAADGDAAEGSDAGGPDATDADSAAPIVVSVVGFVARSGLVTLPPGSRVAHALEAAGGTLPEGDSDSLNLARTLSDGEQILVGVMPAEDQPGVRSAILGPDGGPAPGGQGSGAGSSDAAPGADTGGAGGDDGAALVDLNSADSTALQTLPGVGPATATSILRWREDNGSFASVEQLVEVSGIGPATLEKLRPLVTV